MRSIPVMRISASYQAKSGLNTFLQCCLTVWLILPNPVKMNETCVYPWWASRQKLHVIVFWVPATLWRFVIILKKRDFPHHWRRQAGTSAENIPLKIVFNVALKTIFG